MLAFARMLLTSAGTTAGCELVAEPEAECEEWSEAPDTVLLRSRWRYFSVSYTFVTGCGSGVVAKRLGVHG